MLPVGMEGMRNFLDVFGPASNNEVSKNLHFWIIDEGLLESFFVVCCYAGMVDSDIQCGSGPG